MASTAAPDPVPEPAAVAPGAPAPDVSVVIPCLNEADTVATCVGKARAALDEARARGRDRGRRQRQHRRLARDRRGAGARVVPVASGLRQRPDGRHRRGTRAATSSWATPTTATTSSRSPRFVDKLREGYDLVQGCRLPAGGGTRHAGRDAASCTAGWGNPMFSCLARRWFGAPIHDVYCGMRGFTQGAVPARSTCAARAWSSPPR